MLEKKRLKKLRKKEQRSKEHASVENDDSPHSTTSSYAIFNDKQAPRIERGSNICVPKPQTGIIKGSHSIIESHIQAENSPSEELLRGSIPVTLDENDIYKKQDEIKRVKDNKENRKREILIGSIPITLPENDMHEEEGLRECLRFSRHVAEAFHAKRWKDAIASDHVVLASLFHEPEPPEVDNQEEVPSSKLDDSSTENRLTTLESSAVVKSKNGDNLE